MNEKKNDAAKLNETDLKQVSGGTGNYDDGTIYSINLDYCIYCGVCANQCPGKCIVEDRHTNSFYINEAACLQCGVCEEACPVTGAIVVS